MQKSAILQIFYGEKGSESIPVPKEVRQAVGALADLNDEMLQKIKESPDLSALYEKVCWAFDEVHALEGEGYYVEGFRLGFLLALDVLGWQEG